MSSSAQRKLIIVTTKGLTTATVYDAGRARMVKGESVADAIRAMAEMLGVECLEEWVG